MDGGCYNCGGYGHMKYECPHPRRGRGGGRGGRDKGDGGGGNRGGGNRGGGGRGGASGNDDRERRWFDKVTKDIAAEISSNRDALRLLRAANSFAHSEEGPPGLLFRLETDAGTAAMRKALEFVSSTSDEVYVSGFMPLLSLLGSAGLDKPSYAKQLQRLLCAIYDFRLDITKTIAAGRIASREQAIQLAWFYSTVAVASVTARQDSNVRALCDQLRSFGCDQGLTTVLAGGNLRTLPRLTTMQREQESLPGGRHDNDFADYRSIQALPTREQMSCEEKSFLPRAPPGPTTEAELLDRTFRLYHENVLGPMREALSRIKHNDKREMRYLLEHVNADSIAQRVVSGGGKGASRGGGDGRANRGRPVPSCVNFSFSFPKWHRIHKMNQKQRRDFWENGSHRILQTKSMVCFLRKNGEGQWIPIRFGIVASRDSELLAAKNLIGISFWTTNDLAEIIAELAERNTHAETRLFVAASDFACVPVLNHLKQMTTIPFAEEIVRGAKSAGVDYMSTTQIRECLRLNSKLNEKCKGFDEYQKHAFSTALQKRVALIQGPPGTGKTYIGAALTEVILAASSATVLCVCYTNHALDSFLRDLLDVGITSIVRVGGRCKDERIKPYGLHEMTGDREFTREQKKRYAQLQDAIDEAEDEVRHLERICSREIGAGKVNWWNRTDQTPERAAVVGEYLEDFELHSYLQLEVNADALEDEQGFQNQHIKGLDHLWRRWCQGKDPGQGFQHRRSQPLWKMNKGERQQQKLKWQREIFKDERKRLAQQMQTIQRAQDELKQMRDYKYAATLRAARVIGCTTSGVVMNQDLLSEAGAEVLMLEEAAEIMEPLVLTSLSDKCKHVIMIGDHKQLRPKAEHYPLTVESGNGHNLNESLFERLAKTIEVATLSTQWRMHPEIALIPKLITYPKLLNAPRTEQLPPEFAPIKGIQNDFLGDGRVVFIDHREPEDVRDELASSQGEAVSKTNKYELEMVVAVVRYLCQQGYNPSNLVVLTPYLGQLLKLQEALSADWTVLVGDLDFAEAKQHLDDVAGFNVGGAAATGEQCVRVATIDNYQGEEADICIISLVRSNAENIIGFLQEPERVNVMLSRAKRCEIIIGNSEVLQAARQARRPAAELSGGPLWRKIMGHLLSRGSVFPGLPVQCQTHTSQRNLLCKPVDFANNCPSGGCNLVCRKLMQCGHECTLKCHPVGDCASMAKCMAPVAVACERTFGKLPFTPAVSHVMERPCSSRNFKCYRQVVWKCDGRTGAAHENSSPCHVKDSSRRCKRCDNIERLETELQLKKEQMAEDKARWEEEMDLRQKKAEKDARLAQQKKFEFEQRKSTELAVRRQEIEARRLKLEQQAREHYSTDEVDEQIRKMQLDADKEVADAVRKFKNMLRNREKQADEELEKIHRKRAADMLRIQEESAEQERATEAVIQDCKDALELDRANNAEQRNRIKDEQERRRLAAQEEVDQQRAQLEAERLEIQREAERQTDMLEQQKTEIINALRDKRDRERQIAAIERRGRDAQMQALPGMQHDLASELRTCSICMNDEIRRVDGYLCDNRPGERHFTCDECFTLHVQEESSKDVGRLEATNAQVFCPCKTPALGCENSSAVSEPDLFRHSGQRAFQTYVEAKTRLLEKQLGETIRREERQRMEEEQDRLKRMDQLQREVHDARKHIVEELLTLKCPRVDCRQAFVDFDGCFALTCGRCRCGFCAWCLEDCGFDAHQHVPHCPENPERGNVHGQAVDFDRWQKERRKGKVREYLQGVASAEVREQVVESCRRDLEDLNMHELVREFGEGQGGRNNFEAAVEAMNDAAFMDLDEQLAIQLQMELDEIEQEPRRRR